jgi:hypothetical protein
MGRREQLVKRISKAQKREKTIIIVLPCWASSTGDLTVTWSGRKPTDEEVRAAIDEHEVQLANLSGQKHIEPLGRNADERARTREARAVIEANRERSKQAAHTVWRRCDKCRAHVAVPVDSTEARCENCQK